MVTRLLSHFSAFVLFVCGVVLLFAPDVVLPAVVPGFPPAGAWLGQLLAAGWFGVAVLTWLQRNAVLGGIYGRPTVLANAVVYFISALSLIRALHDHAAPPLTWIAVVVTGALAIGYWALLLRGPFGVRKASTD